MKCFNLIYGLAAVMLLIFTSCGHSDDLVVVEELKLETTKVSLLEGEEISVNILSGNSGYKVSSNTETIATGRVDGNTIIISAKQSGETKLKVVDSQNKTAFINVSVRASLDVEADLVYVAKGHTKLLEVDTEESFVVKSLNVDIAKAEVIADKVLITAIGVGETIITITDSNSMDNVKVIVKEIGVNKSKVDFYVGEITQLEVTGSNNFSVAMVDNEIAEATVENNMITVTAKRMGDTSLNIKDKDTDQVIEIKVNVKQKEELNLDKYSVTIDRKSTEVVRITSYDDKPENYMANYEIQVIEGANLVQIKKGYYDGIFHHFNVKSTGEIGDATLLVRDKITKLEKEVHVTIRPIDLYILNLPNNLTMEVGEQKAFGIKGNGDYQVTLTPTGIVTATAIENQGEDIGVLKIIAQKVGELDIKVTDKITKQFKVVHVLVNAVADDFEVDQDGVLISVKPEALVANMVIPTKVKIIQSKYETPIFNGNSVITDVKMLGIEKIGQYSFSSMSNLTTLEISSTIKTIEKAAFALNKKLTKVTIKATTPPVLESLAFAAGKDKAQRTLYVPKSALSSYQTEEWTKYFGNIVGM